MRDSSGAFIRRLQDEPPRIARRPVRTDRTTVAGSSWIRRAQQRARQSPVRRGCNLEISDGRSLARHADAVRRLEEHSYAFLALGDESGLGESFQSVGG